MSNLIKSEWYRINHTKPSIRIVILCLLGCALISFLGGEMPGFTRNSVSHAGAMSMYMCSMALAALIGVSYTQRITFYEIMDGKSPNAIIFSKLAVYTPLALTCFYFPVSALLLIFDRGTETVKFVVLLFFVFMRIFIFSLFLPMIFKSTESI
ncbi:MAG: hypothetical protein Q8924_19580, partial [Bacillota bacterium]|nr:hypothetical protein [Bacillota bacterium]